MTDTPTETSGVAVTEMTADEAEAASALILDLVKLDAKLKSQGATLVGIITIAAKNAYGIDVH